MLAEELPEEFAKARQFMRTFSGPWKLSFLVEPAFQSFGELSPENLAEDANRKEEAGRSVNPAGAVCRQAAGRDYAMGMRVKLQVLSPRMKDTKEPDLSAEVPRIGRDLQQRFRSRVEQKVVENFPVLQHKRG